MKNLAILFLCAFSVVLFSCENKSQKDEAIEKRDTIGIPVIGNSRSEELKVKSEELSTEKRGESYSKRAEKSSYDNMRGFDPVSEDDMDDHGLSRYMETDDEEGWE